LTVAEVKRGDGAERTGGQTLALLAVPLNAEVVRALAAGPQSLLSLRRAAGMPPETTLRGYLKALSRTGVVERQRRNAFPGDVEYRLTECGEELLTVAEVLSAWLAASPDGPTELGGSGARSAIKALVGGWTASILRAVAVRPLSLTELDSVISSISYPTLERRLGAMRLVGLLERASSDGRSKPYATTEWLRRAVAPIVAAARWERRNFPEETSPITDRDAEAALLLTLPLLRLSEEHSGSCRLGVQIGGGGASALAGAIATVTAGAVKATGTHLNEHVDAWALGSTGNWFSAVIERDAASLEIGGDCALAVNIVEGLHGVLFGSVVAR
jgi:DNA-binding HxlR family transcriptional regulator